MIQKLTLHNFRNHHERLFEFSEKNIVLWGQNGAGKTNILEAISLLSVGKSWRETRASDLIQTGHESALIEAKIDTNDFYRLLVQPRARSFEINEKKVPLNKFFGRIPTLLFAPEFLNLFSDSKKNRQRFFDRFMLQTSPNIRDHLIRFNKAVKQKNALLKDFDLTLFSQNKLHNQLLPWNEILAETIPEIIILRQEFLKNLNPVLQKELQNISQSGDPIEVKLEIKEEYIPTKEGVLEFFEKNRDREMYSKRCLIGAHKDDFLFKYREAPILSTASRGEERSVILALLSAQKKIFKKILKKNPILLLDDVFSELDQSRQDYLENLCSESQIFFTTTHEEHFKNFSFPVQKFEIIPT